MNPTRTHTRRDILRLSGAAFTGSLGLTLAGCVDEDNPAYDVPHPFAGAVGAVGDIPALQTVQREDADVEVSTANELETAVASADGDIIWIADDATIDLTGQDLTVSNAVIASGRGGESEGGVITTDDQGSSSPTWEGGSNDQGLIQLDDNARITGVRIYGPHHSVQDHPYIPGYIPMPDGGRGARDSSRAEQYARGVTIYGDNVSVDNCEIAYFSVQGISVGSTSYEPENTVISHCYIHNNMMTSLGYGVDVRTGHPQIHRCYFDAYRHAVNGSGYANAGYFVTECTFGPWMSSFPVDMHGVFENVSGSGNPDADDYRDRAGGTMVVQNCVFMGTHIVSESFVNTHNGAQTRHAHIRAVPDDGFWFDGNQCAHASPTDGVDQSNVPNDYSTDSNGMTRIYIGENNEWGVNFGFQGPPSVSDFE